MENKDLLEQLNSKLDRLEAAQACRNLMGKYSYYHTAFRNHEYIELWAHRDDCVLHLPWGKYVGFEGVKTCYLEDHGDRTDPEIYEDLKGGVFMHEMDTEVLEVAEDGKTARAAYISPGHETWVEKENSALGVPSNEPGKAHAEWCWGKYAVDFIKEDKGEWKIWHMRLFPMFKAEYGTSWVDYHQPTPDEYSFEKAEKEAPMWQYSPDAVYPANEPEPPLPYATFDESIHKL